jgi:hypothetical protein
MRDVGARTKLLNHQQLNGHGYLYNLDSGLEAWRRSLANLQSGQKNLLNINVVGTSISAGSDAITGTSPNANRDFGYVGRLRTLLQNQYGNVGYGVISANYPAQYDSPYWSLSGTWGTGTWGIGQTARTTTTAGGTATISFNGTGFTLIALKFNQASDITIAVDGGAPTNYVMNQGTSQYVQLSITGLASGNHTLVMNAGEQLLSEVTAVIYDMFPFLDVEGTKAKAIHSGDEILCSNSGTR